MARDRDFRLLFGGFIETLENETSLILTASAAGRESFGCSHTADFTYFGRALFKEELEAGTPLADAYAGALRRVTEWETAEGKEPSEPQMAMGARMRGKLAELEALRSRE